MILARLLTPNEIGQFSIGIALLAIAHMMRDFGIDSYLIQEKHLTHQKIKTATGLTLLISWALASVIYLSRNDVADYYHENNLSTILAWMSINFIIIPFSAPVLALLRREMKFQQIFYINLTSSIIASGVGIYFAYNKYSYMSLVYSSIANIISTATLASLLRPKESLVLPSLKDCNDILSYGGKVSLSNILFTLGTNAAGLIIGKHLGFASVAIFSKAETVNSLLSENFLGAIKKVYLPFISDSHRKNMQLDILYLKAVIYMSSITIPFYCFVFLYAEELILILFGDQWINSAKIIKILSIGGMIQSFWSLSPNTLYAINMPGTVLKCETIIQSFKICLILISAFFSLEIIAWSLVLSNLTSLVFYTAILKNKIKIGIINYIFKTIAPSLTIGISSLLITFYFKLFYKFDTSYLTNTIAGFSVFLLSWITCLTITNHPLKKELDKFIFF